jgi:hypothetical protein
MIETAGICFRVPLIRSRTCENFYFFYFDKVEMSRFRVYFFDRKVFS